MKLVGLMVWYEESPNWLAATIASLMGAGIEHLVAVDGAYFLFPNGRPRSGTEQHCAILETAHACGMGVTLHTPDIVWTGNEVEKRAFMFALAAQIAEQDDWFFVMDADQLVSYVPPGLRNTLAESEQDVAEVTFWERQDPFSSEKAALASRSFNWKRESETRVRILFRAVPGLTVETNHYTYVDGAGRKLWGNPSMGDKLEPALDLSELRIEHRTRLRDQARLLEQRTYYKRRDQYGVEFEKCKRCDERAELMVPADFTPLGPGKMESGYVQACKDCAPVIRAENEQAIRAHGLNPDELLRDGA